MAKHNPEPTELEKQDQNIQALEAKRTKMSEVLNDGDPVSETILKVIDKEIAGLKRQRDGALATVNAEAIAVIRRDIANQVMTVCAYPVLDDNGDPQLDEAGLVKTGLPVLELVELAGLQGKPVIDVKGRFIFHIADTGVIWDSMLISAVGLKAAPSTAHKTSGGGKPGQLQAQFDAVATPEEVAELATKQGNSASWAYKTKVVKAHGG